MTVAIDNSNIKNNPRFLWLCLAEITEKTSYRTAPVQPKMQKSFEQAGI
jgi:hypothetical protein